MPPPDPLSGFKLISPLSFRGSLSESKGSGKINFQLSFGRYNFFVQ